MARKKARRSRGVKPESHPREQPMARQAPATTPPPFRSNPLPFVFLLVFCLGAILFFRQRADHPMGVRTDSWSEANVIVSARNVAINGWGAYGGVAQHQVHRPPFANDPFYYYAHYPLGASWINWALYGWGATKLPALRWPPMLLSVAALVLWYLLVCRFAEPWTALASAIALGTSFAFLGYADNIHQGYTTVFVVGMALSYVAGVASSGRRRLFLLAASWLLLFVNSFLSWEWYLWSQIFYWGHAFLIGIPFKKRWLLIFALAPVLAFGIQSYHRRVAFDEERGAGFVEDLLRRTIRLEETPDTPRGVTLTSYPQHVLKRFSQFYGIHLGLLWALLLLSVALTHGPARLWRAPPGALPRKSNEVPPRHSRESGNPWSGGPPPHLDTRPALPRGQAVRGYDGIESSSSPTPLISWAKHPPAELRWAALLFFCGVGWWLVMLQHTAVHQHVMRQAQYFYALAAGVILAAGVRLALSFKLPVWKRLAGPALGLVILWTHIANAYVDIRMHTDPAYYNPYGWAAGWGESKYFADAAQKLPQDAIVLTNQNRLPLFRYWANLPVYPATVFRYPYRRGEPLPDSRFQIELTASHLEQLYAGKLPPLVYFYQFRGRAESTYRSDPVLWLLIHGSWRAPEAMELENFRRLVRGSDGTSTHPVIARGRDWLSFDANGLFTRLPESLKSQPPPTRAEFGPPR